MPTVSILGWAATILFSICYVPQLVKIIKRKSVADLSFMFFFVQFAANIIALVYATMIGQPPLQFKYIFGLTMDLAILIVYMMYKI